MKAKRSDLWRIKVTIIFLDDWGALLASFLSATLCYYYYYYHSYKKQRCWEFLVTIYTHTQRLRLEKRRRRRCRQYRSSNDAQASKQARKWRNGIDTVPVRVCMFAWLSFSSLSLSFYFFSRSLSLSYTDSRSFFTSSNNFFFMRTT